MRRITTRSVAMALLLLSAGLYLLPPRFLSEARLQLYAWYQGMRAAVGTDAPPTTLEARRAPPSQELADLRRQVEELKDLLAVREAELSETRRRLAQLSTARTFAPQLQRLHFIEADVIGRTGNWPDDPGGSSLILDRGHDSVRPGDVLVQGQAALGQVVEVRDRISRAVLLNHASLVVAARHADSGAECYVHGALEGRCEVVFLGRIPEAAVGDLIFTSGLLGHFPDGLLIGELLEQPSPDRERRTHAASLKPRADLLAVRQVLVVRRPDAPAFPQEGAE
jgi:cell shape-determining protein MreC